MTHPSHGSLLGTQIAYEQALLTDVQLLERRARRGVRVTAADVVALLGRYGTAFEALPHHLQDAIDRIELSG